LDALSGDVLWRKQLLLDDRAGALSSMRMPSATPLLLEKFKIDGNSFSDVLLIPFYQGDLFILNREDGASLMTRKVSLKSSPAVDGTRLFLADTHGEVQAWDIQTGVLLWHRTLSQGELMGPVLWHKQLWVHDDRGQLFRLNEDGDLLDSRTFPGRFDRLPVVTLDGILYHSSLGGLYMVH
jgi:outer membrane protein assembly factor BamB